MTRLLHLQLKRTRSFAVARMQNDKRSFRVVSQREVLGGCERLHLLGGLSGSSGDRLEDDGHGVKLQRELVVSSTELHHPRQFFLGLKTCQKRSRGVNLEGRTDDSELRPWSGDSFSF